MNDDDDDDNDNDNDMMIINDNDNNINNHNNCFLYGAFLVWHTSQSIYSLLLTPSHGIQYRVNSTLCHVL